MDNITTAFEMNYNGNDSDFNCSSSYNEKPPQSVYQPPHCIIYDFVMEAIVMGLFAAFGCVGNCLSLMVLSRDKSKSATPFLLMTLVAAETLFLITVIILRVLNSVYSYDPKSLELIVHLLPFIGSYGFPIAMMAETCTIWLTILVTVNRYISVCRPYEASQLCSKPYARKHVSAVVLLAILYNIPRFFDFTVGPVTIEGPNCTKIVRNYADRTALGRNKIYNIVYHNVMYFLVMYIIPLITLIMLNYKLIKALQEAKRKRQQLISGSDSHSRSEDDITLVLIVVVLVFIICQSPALITQVLESTLARPATFCPNFYFYYARGSDTLVVLNSSMNFIIYIFCSRKFRQIFILLVCKKKLDSPEPSHAKPSKQSNV